MLIVTVMSDSGGDDSGGSDGGGDGDGGGDDGESGGTCFVDSLVGRPPLLLVSVPWMTLKTSLDSLDKLLLSDRGPT